jgi:hemerythrin-like domain-containing protein
MTLLTQQLRDEHRDLLPHVEMLRTVADEIGEAPISSLRHGVDAIYAFLTFHLLSHAQAEERALYLMVGKLMGASEATATMSRDHSEIVRYTEELSALRSRLDDTNAGVSEEKALRRILYGLYAIVKVHFAKEEEIYLPILDTRLTPEKAAHMFEKMESEAQV